MSADVGNPGYTPDPDHNDHSGTVPADLPATDRQRKLIDIFRMQIGMTDVEVDDLARSHGSAMTVLTRKAASAIITDLQRIKEEHQRRFWT